MRGLFISNFEALKSPAITLAGIKKASLEELREFRRQAETILYKSPEAMEPVILEYVRAERVWHNFLERAITYNFEEIFMDMIYILHFINDVKIFKQNYPDRFFILEAEKRPQIYAKVRKVLEDGIVKFLDYAIELKEKQPRMFVEVMSDYELSSQIRGI
jgi:hypothetical protein